MKGTMKFIDFRTVNIHLQEELEFVKTIKNIFKNVVQKISKLGWGQKTSFKYNIPLPIMEEKNTDTKPGGEFAEFIVVDRLYKSFSQSFPTVIITVNGKTHSYESFRRDPFKKAYDSLKNNLGSRKGQVIRWMKSALASAHAIDKSFRIDHPESALLKINIQAVGSMLSGKEKADIIIHVEKMSEDKFIEDIKLSLKTSKGEPWIFNGTQTGGLTMISTLAFGASPNTMIKAWKDGTDTFEIDPKFILSGKYTGDVDGNKSRQHIAAELIEKLGISGKKIEEFRNINIQLDKVCDEIGRWKDTDTYKFRKETELKITKTEAEYKPLLKDAAEKDKQTWKDRKKSAEAKDAYDKARAENLALKDKYNNLRDPLKDIQRKFSQEKAKYKAPLLELRGKLHIPWGEIAFECLEALKKKNKPQYIQSVFKYSGAETGLDYIMSGVKTEKIMVGGKSSEHTRGYVKTNTLTSPKFRPTIDKLFNEMINELDVKHSMTGSNVIKIEITATGYKNPVLTTELYREVNNTRMAGFDIDNFIEKLESI